MKGRRIEDQIELIKVMINKCEADDTNGAIVCLDQEKAYDKITHEFRWATLHKFDFPVHFINTVKCLYASAETHVIINGEISLPFHVRRGVRQGDPLSCLLFNLAIESLTAMLCQSQLQGFLVREYHESIRRSTRRQSHGSAAMEGLT
jgi:Reverse transcriptase (RNA-dependent DNA polymerase)